MEIFLKVMVRKLKMVSLRGGGYVVYSKILSQKVVGQGVQSMSWQPNIYMGNKHNKHGNLVFCEYLYIVI